MHLFYVGCLCYLQNTPVPDIYFDEKKHIFLQRNLIYNSNIDSKNNFILNSNYENVVMNDGIQFGVSRKIYKEYADGYKDYNKTYLYSVSGNEFVYIIPINVSIHDYCKQAEKEKNIKRISLSYYVPITYYDTDPFLISDYVKSKIFVTEAWNKTLGQTSNIIIVDSSIDYNNNDLKAHPSILGDSWNSYYPYSDDGYYGKYVPGYNSHGTGCAGVAAALKDNGFLSCGIAPSSSLISVNIGNTHIQSDRIRYSLIKYSNINGVYSLSWGISLSSTSLVTYEIADLFHFKYMFENFFTNGRNGKGCILVWASGNDKQDGKNTAQDIFTSHKVNIIVGATDRNSRPAYFSRPGSALTISAPGWNVFTTNINNGYKYVYGTSYSCPIVSGVISLMLDLRPDLGTRDVKYILMATAIRPNVILTPQTNNPVNVSWVVNSVGFKFNNLYGSGIVNASKAVSWAKELWYPNLPSSHTIDSEFSNPPNVLNFSIQTNILNNFYTESVVLSANKFRFGSEMVLVSPSGTRNELVPKYSFEYSKKDDFTILSNAFWGENAKGIWKLEVKQINIYSLTSSTFKLHVDGTYTMPNSLKNLLNLENLVNDATVPPFPPPLTSLCTNECFWNKDSECDDGGLGSDWASCKLGSDCTDCGHRSTLLESPPPMPHTHTAPPSMPPQATMVGDPHLSLAHGGKADFRGNDNTFYNLMVDDTTIVNCLIKFVDFKIKKLIVHGSVMTELHVMEKTSHFALSTEAKLIGKHNNAILFTSCSGKSRYLQSYQNYTCGDVVVQTFYSTILILTNKWKMKLVAMDVFGYLNGPTKNMNIEIEPRKPVNKVHGLIGQTFMSEYRVDGKVDVYPTYGEYTTSALAEGAIQGYANDYVVEGKFSNKFVYNLY